MGGSGIEGQRRLSQQQGVKVAYTRDGCGASSSRSSRYQEVSRFGGVGRGLSRE